jgi:hypothetical protein
MQFSSFYALHFNDNDADKNNPYMSPFFKATE